MDIDPESFVGRTLTGMSSSWHEFEGSRSPEPVHLWLFVDGLGSLRFHTRDGLVITRDGPHVAYDMGEHGRVVVEPSGPQALLERVGERIRSVARLHASPPGMTAGVLLEFSGGSVGIADVGDELVVASWPDETWSSRDVSVLGD
ncbi:hypothetical protein [Nocardioides sp. Root190]|uniref:hypothetical protein n=1 Tax=Nocardioides sp. Root190 TaxID=1736488 RepID=UPI0012FB02F9|nr:hypothetical protein [Nocardioides sp. Root190]